MGVCVYLCCLDHKVKIHIRQGCREFFDPKAVDSFLKAHERCRLAHADDSAEATLCDPQQSVGLWTEVEGELLTDILDRPKAPRAKFPVIPIEEHDRLHGFPKPGDEELRRFWEWSASGRKIYPDEKQWWDHSDVKPFVTAPPAWLLERYRRETEQ